jgi:hypothetical protein
MGNAGKRVVRDRGSRAAANRTRCKRPWVSPASVSRVAMAVRVVVGRADKVGRVEDSAAAAGMEAMAAFRECRVVGLRVETPFGKFSNIVLKKINDGIDEFVCRFYPKHQPNDCGWRGNRLQFGS